MKKLELSNKQINVESCKTKAEHILESARKQILEHLRYEIGLFYTAMGFPMPESGEDYIVSAWDISKSPILIDIDVYTFNNDNDINVERWELQEIRITPDNNVLFVIGEREDEFYPDDITIEELVKIASAVEKAYIKKVSK